MNARLAFGTIFVAATIVALAAPLASRVSAAAVAADPTPTPDGILARGKISTVVVIVMENRTFDNVFGGDAIAGHPSPYPGTDSLVPSGIAQNMTAVDFTSAGPGNWHTSFQCAAQSGFSVAIWNALASGTPCFSQGLTQQYQPLQYLSVSDRAVYWQIAQQYEVGDHFFAVTSTDSYPAHQYIVAGQSVDADGDVVAAPYSANTNGPQGCFDLGNPYASVTVQALITPPPSPATLPPSSPGVGWLTPVQRGVEGECYNVPSFADRLAAAQVSWNNYATVDDSGLFNGFNEIRSRYATSWPLSGANVLAIAQAAALPNFSWIKPPCTAASDHPTTGEGGPSWVASVVNAIGGTVQWNTTAIFVVWDDWGGFYDHALPPATRPDGLGPGLRTPFLLISPYVKPGSVATGVADYGSILRFAEDLFSAAPINAAAGTVDTRSPDLTGYFDFVDPPQTQFRPITATSKPWTGACGVPGKRLLQD
jgi:phospholipase C